MEVPPPERRWALFATRGMVAVAPDRGSQNLSLSNYGDGWCLIEVGGAAQTNEEVNKHTASRSHRLRISSRAMPLVLMLEYGDAHLGHAASPPIYVASVFLEPTRIRGSFGLSLSLSCAEMCIEQSSTLMLASSVHSRQPAAKHSHPRRVDWPTPPPLFQQGG